ncbi:hypothetical protein CPB85DRAFT_1261167 [Mucidula mucida]|nr:hypothetical protein CPB85DRAFT_1261167 [Mucidula mucida]
MAPPRYATVEPEQVDTATRPYGFHHPDFYWHGGGYSLCPRGDGAIRVIVDDAAVQRCLQNNEDLNANGYNPRVLLDDAYFHLAETYNSLNLGNGFITVNLPEGTINRPRVLVDSNAFLPSDDTMIIDLDTIPESTTESISSAAAVVGDDDDVGFEIYSATGRTPSPPRGRRTTRMPNGRFLRQQLERRDREDSINFLLWNVVDQAKREKEWKLKWKTKREEKKHEKALNQLAGARATAHGRDAYSKRYFDDDDTSSAGVVIASGSRRQVHFGGN